MFSKKQKNNILKKSFAEKKRLYMNIYCKTFYTSMPKSESEISFEYRRRRRKWKKVLITKK